MKMQKTITGLIAATCTASAVQADVGVGQAVTLTDVNTSVGAGTYTVNGQLTVHYVTNSFSPTNFVVNGDGSDQSPPLGLTFNGRAYLNSGIYNIGATSVSSSTSKLFINTSINSGSVGNSGEVQVGPLATVTTGSFSNSRFLTLAPGSTVSAGTFTSTTSDATIFGAGTVEAGNVDLVSSSLEPGNDASAGMLTFSSQNATTLNDTFLNISVFGGPLLTNDKLAFTGDVAVGGTLLADFTPFTAAELSLHGAFEIVSAAHVSGAFELIAPEVFQAVYNGDAELVGNMELHQTETSVYFQYAPVPEPTTVLTLLGAAGWMLRRRTRGC